MKRESLFECEPDLKDFKYSIIFHHFRYEIENEKRELVPFTTKYLNYKVKKIDVENKIVYLYKPKITKGECKCKDTLCLECPLDILDCTIFDFRDMTLNAIYRKYFMSVDDCNNSFSLEILQRIRRELDKEIE